MIYHILCGLGSMMLYKSIFLALCLHIILLIKTTSGICPHCTLSDLWTVLCVVSTPCNSLIGVLICQNPKCPCAGSGSTYAKIGTIQRWFRCPAQEWLPNLWSLPYFLDMLQCLVVYSPWELEFAFNCYVKIV